MSGKLLLILIVIAPSIVFAQEEAVTASGKTVILFPDSTWKLKVERLIVKDSLASADSITTPKPEKHKKIYRDTTIGFVGFLKPEFKIPELPQQSQGTYQYRVKINKEGIVKEIVSTIQGPNSQTEMTLRNAILKLRFRPSGIPVAPLTEGTVRVVVPEGY